MTDTRALRLLRDGKRVAGVVAERDADGRPEGLRILAEHVFVCGGAVHSPVLLRASGLKRNVGDTLQVHPMLKVIAEFDEVVDAHRAPLPVYQVREFAPDITVGGSVFTPGYLALTLSDNWLQNQSAMEHWRHMGAYYTATRGKGRGRVRVVPFSGQAFVRYSLTEADRALLQSGLLKLCEVLFAAGARRVYPGIRTRAVFTSHEDCRTFLRSPIRCRDMSLSVLHVFGSCPMGENIRRCAVNSYGRMHGLENLYVADASLLPDAPGVNPQGTTMVFARRNARAFLEDA
jgi:choline dehydrogenase-like flavoprotein